MENEISQFLGGKKEKNWVGTKKIPKKKKLHKMKKIIN